VNKNLLMALQVMGINGGFYYNYHRLPIVLSFGPWPLHVTGLPTIDTKGLA
jgi:hypothetical protein